MNQIFKLTDFYEIIGGVQTEQKIVYLMTNSRQFRDSSEFDGYNRLREDHIANMDVNSNRILID